MYVITISANLNNIRMVLSLPHQHQWLDEAMEKLEETMQVMEIRGCTNLHGLITEHGVQVVVY